jgi:exopolyphosphatase/guanosine-5'-triphosphate,3'-diphosphate pyrophosphatase
MARSATLKPIGVVDIGSNSVRLVVYEGATRSPSVLFNEKVLCGLGRSIATTGRLGDDAVERAKRALRRFRLICDQLECARVEVIATAAAREAENGPAFIHATESILRERVTLLTGLREAELAAEGVRSGIHHANGLAGDLGGGSLELIDIGPDGFTGGVTLPLGGLRLIDSSGGSMAKAATIVEAELAGVPWLESGQGRPFYLVGGAWRALARLHMMHVNYPLSVMHNYRMSTRSAIEFAHLLDHLSANSLAGIRDLASARRETVPWGALVLERLLRRVRPSEVVVSVFGIREGLLFSLLGDAERRKDPLIAAAEDLARRRSRSLEAARELVPWTEPLFADKDAAESDEERRLRHAACLVSDIGWRAHPDYRGEQSLNVIAHGTFAGIDHPGRAFLALTVYYRHEGLVKEQLSPRLIDLVDRRASKRARILGAAIRTAHMLSASAPGVLSRTPLSIEGKQLVLTLPQDLAELDGERLERRFKTLAGEMGLEPRIRAGERAALETA